MPWSSIDNDTSRDLDQIEVAERLRGGRIRLRIGIADVDDAVPLGSPIDMHAAHETTTVYAGVVVFPMLPEPLSAGLTSLHEAQDRLVLVTEIIVEPDGHVAESAVYRALARNHWQLTYSCVGPWLEGAAAPPKVAASETAPTVIAPAAGSGHRAAASPPFPRCPPVRAYGNRCRHRA